MKSVMCELGTRLVFDMLWHSFGTNHPCLYCYMYMPTAESSEGENSKSRRNDWNIDGEQAGPSQTEQGKYDFIAVW